MQKLKTQTTQQPLVLKEWVFDKGGVQINELIKTCFIEFYLSCKTAKAGVNA
jgi:hypothetical protein